MAKEEKKKKPKTVNKTIRFPADVVRDVEAVVQEQDRTFSSFIIAAVCAALEEMEA